MLPDKLAFKFWAKWLRQGPKRPPKVPLTRNEKDFIKYVEDTWMKPGDKCATFGHWDNEGPRTTNPVESYHGRTQRQGVPKRHSRFPRWLKFMKTVHSTNLHTALRWSLGHDTIKQKEMYRILNTRVRSAKFRLTYRLHQLAKLTDEQLHAILKQFQERRQEPSKQDRSRIEYYVWLALKHFRTLNPHLGRQQLNALIDAKIASGEVSLREQVEGEIINVQSRHVACLLADSNRKKKTKEWIEGTSVPKTKAKKGHASKKTKAPNVAPKQTQAEAVPTPETEAAEVQLRLPRHLRNGGPDCFNSCTIDNLVMGIYSHLLEFPNFRDSNPAEPNDRKTIVLREALVLMRENRVEAARSKFVQLIRNEQYLRPDADGRVDLHATEYDRLISVYSHVWRHKVETICNSESCPQRVREENGPAMFSLRQSNGQTIQRSIEALFSEDFVLLNRNCGAESYDAPDAENDQMQLCAGERHRTGLWFQNGRPWMVPIFITSLSVDGALQLPENVTIKGQQYRRAAITFYRPGHFVAVIKCAQDYYFYDDLQTNLLSLSESPIANGRYKPQLAIYLLCC